MRILVTGGTGTVGSRVVKGLAARGVEVHVMTRAPDGQPGLPEGCSYVQGELEDRESVIRAMSEVDRVYLLTPLHPNEAQLGRDAIWAAADARVDRVVFQSVHRAEDGEHIPHFRSKVEILDELKRSGLSYAVVAPNNFFQNDLWMLEPITQHGVYPAPVGSVGISRVDCDDIAAAAVKCLLESGHEGKEYSLAGPHALTGNEVALIWTTSLGRPVRYTGDDLDAWEQSASHMMPAWMVADLRIMFEHFLEHGLVATAEELTEIANLLGRPPRSYKDWVAGVAADWV